jgi:hypothetical protein
LPDVADQPDVAQFDLIYTDIKLAKHSGFAWYGGYALQVTIPYLTRSNLHLLFQRHDISCLPNVDEAKPRKKFKAYFDRLFPRRPR